MGGMILYNGLIRKLWQSYKRLQCSMPVHTIQPRFFPNPISIPGFLKAEDAIRDYKVTGVQTCALPIYSLPRRVRARRTRRGRLCRGPDRVDPHRSEERRVGKEWRSRWSPYH